ncbi:MAG: pilus assembly protein N-terminal domain-containing protein [Planctomycetota bacterium]
MRKRFNDSRRVDSPGRQRLAALLLTVSGSLTVGTVVDAQQPGLPRPPLPITALGSIQQNPFCDGDTAFTNAPVPIRRAPVGSMATPQRPTLNGTSASAQSAVTESAAAIAYRTLPAQTIPDARQPNAYANPYAGVQSGRPGAPTANRSGLPTDLAPAAVAIEPAVSPTLRTVAHNDITVPAVVVAPQLDVFRGDLEDEAEDDQPVTFSLSDLDETGDLADRSVQAQHDASVKPQLSESAAALPGQSSDEPATLTAPDAEDRLKATSIADKASATSDLANSQSDTAPGDRLTGGRDQPAEVRAADAVSMQPDRRAKQRESLPTTSTKRPPLALNLGMVQPPKFTESAEPATNDVLKRIGTEYNAAMRADQAVEQTEPPASLPMPIEGFDALVESNPFVATPGDDENPNTRRQVDDSVSRPAVVSTSPVLKVVEPPAMDKSSTKSQAKPAPPRTNTTIAKLPPPVAVAAAPITTKSDAGQRQASSGVVRDITRSTPEPQSQQLHRDRLLKTLAGSTSEPTSNETSGSIPADADFADAPRLIVSQRQVRSLTVPGEVCRVSVDDPNVCQAIAAGPDQLKLIGVGSGETRLAVWVGAEGHETQIQLFQVRVDDGTKAPVRVVHSQADILNHSIQRTFPSANVTVTQIAKGLSVQGTCEDNTTAKQIMRMVRKACLVPVHDNIVIR